MYFEFDIARLLAQVGCIVLIVLLSRRVVMFLKDRYKGV